MSGKAQDTRAELRERGYIPVTVDGDCMEPALRRGQVVVVRGGAARPGDVVLLDASGWLEIHRVIARAGRWLVHRGDAGAAWGLARERDVLGLVPAAPRRRAPVPSGVEGPALRAAAALDAVGASPALRAAGRLLTKALSRLSPLP